MVLLYLTLDLSFVSYWWLNACFVSQRLSCCFFSLKKKPNSQQLSPHLIIHFPLVSQGKVYSMYLIVEATTNLQLCPLALSHPLESFTKPVRTPPRKPWNRNVVNYEMRSGKKYADTPCQTYFQTQLFLECVQNNHIYKRNCFLCISKNCCLLVLCLSNQGVY